MFRRYLLTGLVAGFLSISSTLYPVKLTDTRGVKEYVESFLFNGVYAGESEIILKDNTTASGLTVKEETANTTIARFRGDGNVGIGTTGPNHALEVVGDGRMVVSDGLGAERRQLAFNTPTSANDYAEIFANKYGTGAGGKHIAMQMYGGNVGIGTTGPNHKLQVYDGNLALIGSAWGDEYLYIGDTNWGFRTVSQDATFSPARDMLQLRFYDTGSRGFGFYDSAGSQYRMVITAGNVGIGTTSPQHPLHMGSGAHVTTGGVWTNASSREYKKNIRDLTVDEAMQTLDGLRPSRFNYKVDDEDEYIGFIAEDVPELVATRDRKGLSPMDVTAVLTKVVQEQQRMLQA